MSHVGYALGSCRSGDMISTGRRQTQSRYSFVVAVACVRGADGSEIITMKHSLVTLLLPFLVSVSVTGFAADAGDLILGGFDGASKKERLEIARDILGRVEKLSNYVATPKPSEIAWVHTEQEAIASLKGTDAYDERVRQLYQSPEFQNLKLRILLDGIENTLQCVTSDDTNLRKEILCWSRASLDLSNRATLDDAIMILKKHDRLPKDIADKAELGLGNYSEDYDWMARGINEYIVIPYLQGRIME